MDNENRNAIAFVIGLFSLPVGLVGTLLAAKTDDISILIVFVVILVAVLLIGKDEI